MKAAQSAVALRLKSEGRLGRRADGRRNDCGILPPLKTAQGNRTPKIAHFINGSEPVRFGPLVSGSNADGSFKRVMLPFPDCGNIGGIAGVWPGHFNEESDYRLVRAFWAVAAQFPEWGAERMDEMIVVRREVKTPRQCIWSVVASTDDGTFWTSIDVETRPLNGTRGRPKDEVIEDRVKYDFTTIASAIITANRWIKEFRITD